METSQEIEQFRKELSNTKVALLQLQRSALIDTQIMFQLLIRKGLCTVEEITDIKEQVESTNDAVIAIDAELAKLVGRNQHLDQILNRAQAGETLTELDQQYLVKQVDLLEHEIDKIN